MESRIGPGCYRPSLECSTLFSIKDGITISGWPGTWPGRSAQRFSASKMESLGVPYGFEILFGCSTLFSIKDGITDHQGRAGAHPGVLNAFQHQRWNHRPPPLSWFDVPSAQRFSASKMESRHGRRPGHPGRRVLNAFQHQRWNHVDVLSLTMGLPRAQRFSASKMESQICTIFF